MRILRATHLGMCFGVRDAIALALEHADAGPLTILGDLVHNPTVLKGLEAKGIAVAQDVAAVKTPVLMVTAHGTSERSLARTRALGLTVVEATCPLVRVAHRAAAALTRDGYHIVIVGQRNHGEVVKTCARFCASVHHVQTDADVRPEWFDAANVVGLTAGTSTPDDVIDRVEARIRVSDLACRGVEGA